MVANLSRSTENLNQRRFSIETMSPTFVRHSTKTIAQAGIILTLEHIKRRKGKHVKPGRITVKWYCDRYKEIFPTTPGSVNPDVPLTHQVRVRDLSPTIYTRADLTSLRPIAAPFTQPLQAIVILQLLFEILWVIKGCSPKMPSRSSSEIARRLGLCLQKFVNGGVSGVWLNLQFLRGMK
jgi:hypothetical protein